jgi:hypothetical protein
MPLKSLPLAAHPPQPFDKRQDLPLPFLYNMSGPSNPPTVDHSSLSATPTNPTVSTPSSVASASPAMAPVAKPAIDPVVTQALEIARESPDGAADPTISNILEGALSHLWSKVQAAPEAYIMSKDEFSLFNFYQHRFEGDQMAVMARRRYWDNTSG